MLRRFLRDSAIYGLSNVLLRGVSLLLVPVYTRILSPTDYGIVDLITVFTALVGVSVALEIAQGLARFLPDATTPDERSAYASTALWFTIAAYVVFTVAAVIFAEPLSALLLDDPARRDLLLVALPVVVGSAIFYLLQMELRYGLRPKQYAICSLIYSGLGIAASVALVAGLRIGVAGVFIGQAIGAVAGIAASLAWSRSVYRLRVDVKRLREMLAFSLPLLPSSLGVFVTLYVDRIAIRELLNLHELGLFGVGYRIASIVTLLVVGFQGALTPLIYTHYREPGTPRELARIFSFFIFVALTLCLVLALFAGELVRLVAAPAYWTGALVVPFLAPALLLSMMYIFAPGLAITKRTGMTSTINLIGAGLNAVLSFSLVPLFGISGAAGATLISAATIFSLSMITSQIHYPVPHAWPRLALASLVGLLVFLVGSQLPVGGWASVALKAALVALAVSAFFALGLLGAWRIPGRPDASASVEGNTP